MSQRRKAREAILKALYAHEVSQNDSKRILDRIIEPNVDYETYGFAKDLFNNVISNQAQIDEIITSHINNWSIDRLTTVDRLLLRMAIAEFLFLEEVPPKVSMNEAIEIAKRFSTRRSGKFVNGILDSALQQLQEEGGLNKEGRGLINTSLKS